MTKISALTQVVPALVDYLETVDDPQGTPVSRRTTIGRVAALLASTRCGITNSGVDANNDIVFDTNPAFGPVTAMKLAASRTKQIDATWVAGDNAGGLFSGSVANNTWYYCFLIEKDSDLSIDCGFDTSPIAANIPTGYTNYAYVGAITTEGTPKIQPFSQMGKWFLQTPTSNILSTTTPATSDATLTVPCPTTATGLVMRLQTSKNTAEATLSFKDTNGTVLGYYNIPDNSISEMHQWVQSVDSSQQIDYVASSAANWDELILSHVGHFDGSIL